MRAHRLFTAFLTVSLVLALSVPASAQRVMYPDASRPQRTEHPSGKDRARKEAEQAEPAQDPGDESPEARIIVELDTIKGEIKKLRDDIFQMRKEIKDQLDVIRVRTQ
ncbi:MAG: hypothetical protein ABIJ27_02805 [Candidatus Omnitrophota bacterium]